MGLRILNWLESRTGYRGLLGPIYRRVLPTGPKWAYASASCLLWLFVMEVVTGFFLMTTYSPSTMTAWASVHYIEQSPFGSFLRGLHYFVAQAIIVLLVLHILRVLVSAAFRAPRELIWVSGLLLLPLMIVWAITGNPLSASQKGIAQIEVEGNILGSTPLVGPVLQTVLIGGDDVGHLTLTHLYFLHVGLMPLLVTVLLTIHVAQIYRHGVTPLPAPGDFSQTLARPYWPYQTVRNMTVLAGVLGFLVYCSLRFGAPLEAPADPTLHHIPRPEWYFRSLFELRRYFTGDWEFVATMVVPGVSLAVLLIIPIIDRWTSPRASLVLRLVLIAVGICVGGGLTLMSFARDWQDTEYQAAEAELAVYSQRARSLADHQHIPPEGAQALLRRDPKTQGPLLFQRHCASCHSHADSSGVGIVAAEPSAPNLFGVGRPEWIGQFLDPERIKSPACFGKTKFAEGDMVTAIAEKFEAAESDEARQNLRKDLEKVAQALAAEAELGKASAEEVESGKALLTGDLACTDCHKFHDAGELGSAPDLTGYASRAWLLALIANPRHERFYPEDRNDRMPAFFADPAHPRTNLLSEEELSLLVDWLRGTWFEEPR